MNIGLGTAAIGRPLYININQKERGAFEKVAFVRQGRQVLDAAYQQGVRYFDTAPGYGLAEQLLLDWVIDKNDPSIEVATKWGYTYVADFNSKATIHEVKDHSLVKLNEQWDVSKQLLPYLKTLQIHSATFETGVLQNKSVLDRLTALKNEFGIKIGLTTTGSNQVDVITEAAKIVRGNKPLFDLYQVTYNILDQSISQIVEQLSVQGSRLVIKEALANGRVFRNENYPQYQHAYDVLGQLAEKYSVGVDAIALRYVMESIHPYMVLSGASVKDHVIQNLKANDFELSKEELVLIKACQVEPEAYWSARKQLAWN